MIGLWLGLNIMDLATTLFAFEQGVGEANPMIGDLGGAELIAYKIIFTLLALLLLARLGRLPLLKPLCLGMALVVIWNLVWVV